jgi:hypothetical protein
MRTPLILTALAASLALAGCGEHGGIGAESTSKSAVSASTETKVDRSREVKHNTSAKATISMPAAGLIFAALRDYVAAEKPCGKKDPHITAARDILSVARPVAAWPVACFGCSAQASWAHAQAVRVADANLVLTELAGSLPSQALADPSVARKAIVTTFLSIPSATLAAARHQAEKQVRGGSFTPDFSGGEGVHFLLGASDFKGGPAGWSWAKDGVTWYGDGALSGQKFEVALDSAIDTGMTESSGAGTTTGTSQENANSGNAGVK